MITYTVTCLRNGEAWQQTMAADKYVHWLSHHADCAARHHMGATCEDCGHVFMPTANRHALAERISWHKLKWHK